MRKVRTTKQPWLEIEVDDAEHLDLTRQGLLLAEPVAEQKTRRASVPPADKED